MTNEWYTLNEDGSLNGPVDIMEYMAFDTKQKADGKTHWRKVGRDIVGDYEVSTIFLGLDHRWEGDRPVLWETMIFVVGDREDLYCARYTSHEDAENGHRKVLSLLKEGKKPGDLSSS